MKCKYLNDKFCLLASKIAQKNVIPHETACEFCTNKAQPPQSINEVTISLSISNNKGNKQLQDNIIKEYGHLLRVENDKLKQSLLKRLNDIKNGTGVGSNVWRILESIDIKHNENCPCLDWAERLNNWGPRLCRENRKQIIEHFKESAKNYDWGDLAKAIAKAMKTGLAFKLSILDPFGSLLGEAIEITENNENKLLIPDDAFK